MPGYHDGVPDTTGGVTETFTLIKPVAVQTTDGTETTVYSVAMAEGDNKRFKYVVVATDATHTKHMTYVYYASFYRVTSGDVTQQGSLEINSASWRTDTTVKGAIDANTGTQQVDFKVQSTGGGTITWQTYIHVYDVNFGDV